MIQTEFSLINTMLTGDLEFSYDIENIKTEYYFANLLARDEQLAHYYTVARLLGETLNQWEEMQFTFTDLVISGKIAHMDWGLQLKIEDAYLPASLLDIDYREGMRAIRIPKIADNIHIKQVEGYEFKSKMLAPLEIDTQSIVHIDDNCLRGLYLHSPFLCSNKSSEVGYILNFDCLSNYMENCIIKRIQAIKTLGIERFFKAGNRVGTIEDLIAHREFNLGDSIISEKVIFNYLHSFIKLTNGVKIERLFIYLNIGVNDAALLVQQLDIIANVFLHFDSINRLVLNIGFTDGSKSYRVLGRDSDSHVEITYPGSRAELKVGDETLTLSSATTHVASDKVSLLFNRSIGLPDENFRCVGELVTISGDTYVDFSIKNSKYRLCFNTGILEELV